MAVHADSLEQARSNMESGAGETLIEPQNDRKFVSGFFHNASGPIDIINDDDACICAQVQIPELMTRGQ